MSYNNYESEMFTTGLVIAVHPSTHTCDVRLTTGGYLYSVPMLNSTGGVISNDVASMANLRGAVVVLMQVVNTWYILATVPTYVSTATDLTETLTGTETGGNNSNTYGNGSTNSNDFSAGRTTEYLPGDKVISTDGGSALVLGEEGLAILKASPLAQLILGAYKDFGRLIAREFEMYTDFGTMRFTGGGPTGRTSFVLQGGATYCDESGTDEPIYTVTIYAGDVPGDPDARYALYVESADRSQSVRIVADAKGTISLDTTTNLDAHIGNDATTVVNHNDAHYVVGDQTIVIGENPNAEADAEVDLESDPEDAPVPSGFRTTTVKKDDTLVIEGSQFDTVNVDRSTEIKGNDTRTVGGDSDTEISGDEEKTVKKDRTLKIVGNTTLTTSLLTINAGGMAFNYDSSLGDSGACTLKVKSLKIEKA